MTVISDAWDVCLASELASPQLQALMAALQQEEAEGRTIYPPAALRFAALQATSPAQVKVVILGQDPYHGPGQAHGLSFSVLPGQKIPPSLRNIYKELARDPAIDFSMPTHGCLQHWAEQGVLLLNAVLSVEAGQPNSHQGRGWEPLTDSIIEHLSSRCEHLVFMLWGGYAQKKAGLIDAGRHLILQTTHPSPLSAHRGFLGCGHFSAANDWLQAQGRQPVDWCVPELETRSAVRQPELFGEQA